MKKKYLKNEKLTFKALGTEIDLQIVVENDNQSKKASKDLQIIKAELNLIEKKFSRFDSESELSILNQSHCTFCEVSEEMIDIAKKILLYYEVTEGIFDPRIIENLELSGYDKSFESIENSEKLAEPDKQIFNKSLAEDLLIRDTSLCFCKRMDFSGLIKGYAADRMAKILFDRGWKNFLVDLGGDMFFAGIADDGKRWKIGVEGIKEEKLIFELSQMGIATSGISRRKWEKEGKRFHHLVNPKNVSEFSFDLQSVTVVNKKVEIADIWAKTLFLLGKKGAKKLADERKIACVILEYNGTVWISSEAKKYLYDV